jgi:hypothetical protein
LFLAGLPVPFTFTKLTSSCSKCICKAL